MAEKVEVVVAAAAVTGFKQNALVELPSLENKGSGGIRHCFAVTNQQGEQGSYLHSARSLSSY